MHRFATMTTTCNDGKRAHLPTRSETEIGKSGIS
jgi:hypothetical protein